MDKTIGILGGVGPAATAYLHQEVIDLCQELYGAIHDHEYPNIIVSSIPCGVSEKGVNSYNKNKVRDDITKQIMGLVSMDVDVIVPACNTLDLFYKDIQKITSVPVISLPGSVKNKIKQDGISGRIGVLSSEATNEQNIYEGILGVDIITADNEEQDIVTDLIYQAMGGDVRPEKIKEVLSIVNRWEVDVIVLGCTELPITGIQDELVVGSEIADVQNKKIKIIDAGDLAIREALEIAYNK